MTAQSAPRIVVKIGGSTIGSHDTTLEDLATLQRLGEALVVVHGGGALISEWLQIHGVPSRFVDGLRVTDDRSLPVVIAVLAGLVNKELVASIGAFGGRAVGITGVDAGLVKAAVLDPDLGYVGAVLEVEAGLLLQLIASGYMPVIAPVASLYENDRCTRQILNINADTMAGEIAKAIGAKKLVLLTDVPGVKNRDGRVMTRISLEEIEELRNAEAISGGMIPKIEACLLAIEGGAETTIVDGREPHALLAAVRGEAIGTRVG